MYATYLLPLIILGTVMSIIVLCCVLQNCDEEPPEENATAIVQQQGSGLAQQQQGRQNPSHQVQSQSLQSRQGQQHRSSNAVPSNHTIKQNKDDPTTNYRPFIGRILKSISHGNNVETGSNKNTADLDADDVHLFVDFGDSDMLLRLNETSCPICCIDYDHGDRVQRSCIGRTTTAIASSPVTAATSTTADGSCNHIFHERCINIWMETTIPRRSECPICRQPFVIGTRSTTITGTTSQQMEI